MGVASATTVGATTAGAPTSPTAIEWGASLVPPETPPRAIADDVRRHIGTMPGWVPFCARVPWVARAISRIVANPFVAIRPELTDLIAMIVSQDNSCRYCYGATRALLQIHGYTESYITQLERDFHVAELRPGERAALELARRVSRGHPRPGRADFEEAARAGLGRDTLVEIATMAAACGFSNRVLTLLAMPPQGLESLVHSRLFRFIRPFVAWRMRAFKPPVPPPLGRNEGFASDLIAALTPSPSAAVIRGVVDEAWASEVLPRRTKALLFLVVARALGCPHIERDARRLLAQEGLSDADLDAVLAHLAAPGLDAREERLVPFARETVRYHPATVQDRLRTVMAGASPAEVVEAAGVLALANALSRVSVVLDAC